MQDGGKLILSQDLKQHFLIPSVGFGHSRCSANETQHFGRELPLGICSLIVSVPTASRGDEKAKERKKEDFKHLYLREIVNCHSPCCGFSALCPG